MLDIELVVLSPVKQGWVIYRVMKAFHGFTASLCYGRCSKPDHEFVEGTDRYTAELMTRFYTYLLEPGDPATALRRAQLDLSTERMSITGLFAGRWCAPDAMPSDGSA